MSVTSSIQTTLRANITVRITVSVSASSDISITYDGTEILATTTVADVYGFDYTPDVSDGIMATTFDSGITGSTTITEKYKNYHTPYNNGAGVMAFKEGKNGWTSHLTFSPDYMVAMGDDMYSFKDGVPYIHDGEKNTFYETEYQSVISFRVSGVDGVIEIMEYMATESEDKPDYVHVVAENPHDQATDLCGSDFVYIEGTYYASLLNDKLSPNFVDASESVNYTQALINGDEMRAKWFDVFFVFNNNDFRLSAVNFGLTVSSGHRK